MLAAQAIHSAAELIAAASSPAKVIVFGSCARGESREECGLDSLLEGKA
jgi:predicted nucleotidyltransferase